MTKKQNAMKLDLIQPMEQMPLIKQLDITILKMLGLMFIKEIILKKTILNIWKTVLLKIMD